MSFSGPILVRSASFHKRCEPMRGVQWTMDFSLQGGPDFLSVNSLFSFHFKMATTASNNKNLSTRMKAIEIANGFFDTAELTEYQTKALMSLLQELDSVIAQPTGSHWHFRYPWTRRYAIWRKTVESHTTKHRSSRIDFCCNTLRCFHNYCIAWSCFTNTSFTTKIWHC